MKSKYKNLLVIAAISCIVVFGATLAFLKDSESKKNIVEIGNIKLELTETEWTADEKKAVPGQIFPKNPALTNTGKNDEYVFLEVSMPMEEVQMLYENDIYQNGSNYAVKIGDSYYQAGIETSYKKTANGVIPSNPVLVKPLSVPETYTYEDASGKICYAIKESSDYKIYERTILDDDIHYIDTGRTLAENTPVFFKETSNEQDIYKYDDNGTEKYVVRYNDDYYQATFNDSYYTRTNTIVDNVVILESFADPDIQYVYSYTEDSQTKYAVKKTNQSNYYEAEQEITFTKTDTEISDVSGYTKTSYESGTKKGSESLQEIFRTIADTNGEKITIDNQTFDFSYHAGNATTEGWVFLGVSDITERDIKSGEEKYYRKYLFGYNQKLNGDISNASETPASTIALFDEVQLKSFIDEKILGAEKKDADAEKQRYESKLEEIKIRACGIQADNLSLTLGEFLTKAQLNQIYDIARQKMG